MSKFTIVAPRSLWEEVTRFLTPVPFTSIIWCREPKPDEIRQHSVDIEDDLNILIYQVQLFYDGSATSEEITLIESLLQKRWSYVKAEQEPPLWFETVRNCNQT